MLLVFSSACTAVIPSVAHTAVCSVPMANLVLLVLLLELMLEVSLLPGFRMLDLIGPAWRLPVIYILIIQN